MAENVNAANSYTGELTGTAGENGRALEDETAGCSTRYRVRERQRLLAIIPYICFFIIFVFSIGCTTARYLQESSESERFLKWITRLWIIIWKVVAFFFLFRMMKRASTKPIDDDDEDAHLRLWQRLIRHNIKLFGIVLFFFAIFVFGVISLIAGWKCEDAWKACASYVISRQHVADDTYMITLFGYLFAELIFCVWFNGTHFCQEVQVLVGLAMVEATNLSVWLDALIDETIAFSPEGNWADELSCCFNATGVNISNHFIQCYSRTTHEYELRESASPYLYPFIMEYLMLVVECFGEWFFTAAPHEEHADARQQPADNASMDASERQPLLPQSSSSASHPSDGNEQHVMMPRGDRPTAPTSTSMTPSPGNACCRCYLLRQTQTAADRRKQAVLFYLVVVMILVSLTYVILGIYNLSIPGLSYLYVLTGYRIFFWLLVSLFSLIGCCACNKLLYEQCCNCPSGRWPCNLNFFEGFVIFSSIGPIMQCIFSMVANLRSEGRIAMFLADEILNMLQIATQVIFYVLVKRIQRTRADGNEEIRHRCYRRILTVVISFFVVCNFAVWVEDSFIETRNSEISWEKDYFNNWPLWYNLFNPFTLWFRFNSALLFLNAVFHKRLAA